MARYAGQLLAPAAGFGLQQRLWPLAGALFLSYREKYALIFPNSAIFGAH